MMQALLSRSALTANHTLRCLYLAHVGLGDEGAAAVGDALTANRGLTSLDIRCDHKHTPVSELGWVGIEAVVLRWRTTGEM
jgi:hypothetical protein